MIPDRPAALQQYVRRMSWPHHKSNFLFIRYMGITWRFPQCFQGNAPIRRRSLAGLHQRAVPAGAFQQGQKAEYAGGKQHQVQPQRIHHQVGMEGVVE